MAELLEVLTSRFDIMLIDTPPLLPVTDAAILPKITGGALVVVGADLLNRQQFAQWPFAVRVGERGCDYRQHVRVVSRPT